MIKLLVDSILDAVNVTIKLTKNAFNIESSNKLTQIELEKFFLAIDLKNKNLVDNSTPRLIEVLEQTTRLDKFILSNPNKNIIITSYKELMKDFYNFKYVKCLDYKFFGGYNLYEEECIFSLRRNMLISGSVGQGKTSTLQGILLNRIWNNRNNENCIGVDINIIDLKGTDLVYFKDIEEVENIAIDTEQAKELLLKLKEEMQNRNKIFRDKKVSSI